MRRNNSFGKFLIFTLTIYATIKLHAYDFDSRKEL
jgi:hypothetical protein